MPVLVPIIDTCPLGHMFAKLYDHPTRDGLARCPHCLAIGLDEMRSAKTYENGVEDAARVLATEANDLEQIAQDYLDGKHRGRPELQKRIALDFIERADAVHQMIGHVRSLSAAKSAGIQVREG